MVDAPPILPTTFRCIGCNYDLSGTAIGSTCPECGVPVSKSLEPRMIGERSCGAATACFVLGLISLAGCILTGPIAIFYYFRARREMQAGGYSKSAKTFATVGLVLGIISSIVIVGYAVLFAIVGLIDA